MSINIGILVKHILLENPNIKEMFRQKMMDPEKYIRVIDQMEMSGQEIQSRQEFDYLFPIYLRSAERFLGPEENQLLNQYQNIIKSYVYDVLDKLT